MEIQTRIRATIANAAAPINRSGGFGRLRLMTAGGWLFIWQSGRKLEQKRTGTKLKVAPAGLFELNMSIWRRMISLFAEPDPQMQPMWPNSAAFLATQSITKPCNAASNDSADAKSMSFSLRR